ncbi:MAG: hypothetical protein QXO21_02765 [Candidatus Anstonellales archaeon]
MFYFRNRFHKDNILNSEKELYVRVANFLLKHDISIYRVLSDESLKRITSLNGLANSKSFRALVNEHVSTLVDIGLIHHDGKGYYINKTKFQSQSKNIELNDQEFLCDLIKKATKSFMALMS